MTAQDCVGCGAAGKPFIGAVVACDTCVVSFVEIFSRDPVPEGIAIPEGPISRIADAVLAEMGQAPARSIAAPVSPVVWRDARIRTPRRGRMRR